MKSLSFILLLLIAYSYANHFAHVGFFEDSSCSTDPIVVSPIYPGEAELCFDSAGTSCLRQFDADTDVCAAITYSETSSGVLETTNYGTNEVNFGDCLQSAISGCFFRYNPVSTHFTISGNNKPSDLSFAGFVNYFTTTNCNINALEFRKPLFTNDGTPMCDDSSATTCTGALRGFSLPSSDPNKDCTEVDFSTFGCIINDVSSQASGSNEIGVCTDSGRFSGCGLQFTDGSGFFNCDSDNDDDDVSTFSTFTRSYTTITDSFTYSNNDDDDNSNSDDDNNDDDNSNSDDDNSNSDDDNNDDDSSSSDASILTIGFTTIIGLFFL